MGLHSGLSDPKMIAVNKASQRTVYSGSFVQTAKEVADTAAGGMIILSEATREQLLAATGSNEREAAVLRNVVVSKLLPYSHRFKLIRHIQCPSTVPMADLHHSIA